MLGLPEKTELRKQIAKVHFVTHGDFKRGEQSRFDDYVSSVYVVNEINSHNVAVSDDGDIKHFYVLLVEVKTKKLDDTSLKIVERTIKQRKILVLKYGDEYKCLAYYGSLVQTDWGPLGTFNITLQGTTVTALWESVIKQLGDIRVDEGKTLTEQIKDNEQRAKLEKEIERLESKSRKANQVKEKMEYHQKAVALRKLLDVKS